MHDPDSRITVRIYGGDYVFEGGTWTGGESQRRRFLNESTVIRSRHDTASQVVGRMLQALGAGEITSTSIVTPVEDLALGVG